MKGFVGSVLPKGEQLSHRAAGPNSFNEEQVKVLQFKPDMPIFNEHDEFSPVGNVMRTFTFKGGEKGVVAKIDPKTPTGVLATRSIKPGRGLSLTHNFAAAGAQPGGELFGEKVTRPSYGYEKNFISLSSVETPRKDGCRVLFLFDDPTYNEFPFEDMAIEEVELMSTNTTATAKKPEEEAYLAKLAEMDKEALIDGNIQINDDRQKKAARVLELEEEKKKLEEQVKDSIDRANQYQKMLNEGATQRISGNVDELGHLFGFSGDDVEKMRGLFLGASPTATGTPEEKLTAFEGGLRVLVENGRSHLKSSDDKLRTAEAQYSSMANDFESTTGADLENLRETKKRKASTDAPSSTSAADLFHALGDLRKLNAKTY